MGDKKDKKLRDWTVEIGSIITSNETSYADEYPITLEVEAYSQQAARDRVVRALQKLVDNEK